MRTFIAIELAPDVKRALVRLLGQLPRHADVRWVTEDQLHLTLKFLGEVGDDELTRVCDAAAEACAAVPPFTLQMTTLGVFPAPRNPRVLWVGVDDAARACQRWVEVIDPELVELNFKPETRAFTPHITLGRSRSTAGGHVLRDALETITLPATELWEVSEVVVFESQLGRGGARYQPLARLPLGPA